MNFKKNNMDSVMDMYNSEIKSRNERLNKLMNEICTGNEFQIFLNYIDQLSQADTLPQNESKTQQILKDNNL